MQTRIAGRFPWQCLFCKQVFAVYASRRSRRYCSRICATAASKRGKTFSCIVCQRVRYLRPSYLNRVTQKYCSLQCWKTVNHGANSPAWKGGRVKRSSGYMNVLIGKQYRMEHRVVMENLLGRPLRQDEVVHHRDHDRTNNAPENLQLMSRVEHGHHHSPPGADKRKKKVSEVLLGQ